MGLNLGENSCVSSMHFEGCGEVGPGSELGINIAKGEAKCDNN